MAGIFETFKRVTNPSMEYHEEFMKMAIEYSEISLDPASKKGPFGAVITYDGKLVAAASNEVMKNNDPTCHGEVNCIRKACEKLRTYDLTGAVLYTSSEPCPMCLSAIIWANISKVYYANTAVDAGNIGFRDDHIYKWLSGDKSVLALDLEHKPQKEALEVFEKYGKIGKIY